NFPDREVENRAVDRQRLAVLRKIQQSARLRDADSLSADRMAVDSRQSVLRHRYARNSGTQAIPYRRQRADQVLRQSEAIYRQGSDDGHGGRRLRVRREQRRELHGWNTRQALAILRRLHDVSAGLVPPGSVRGDDRWRRDQQSRTIPGAAPS